tara:strand:+ start:499 stop:1434 length:936 start_codon:yes stop_codon:yes gene_type:complete
MTLGIALLIMGSNYFVNGVASIAQILNIPIIVIGLTIVAFATSAPEILVSIVAALNNESDLAVGNAVGSNTANIGLVLGVMASIKPISIDSKVHKKLMILLLLVSLSMILPFWDNTISLFEGRFILLAFLLVMSWLIRFSLKIHNEGNKTKELPDSDYNIYSAPKAIIMLIIGLTVLTFGANLVVENAIKIAEILGVSQTIIGITLVAIGTSLPELSVSITSAIKGEYGLAIGNIIGSNIFNLLAVIGIATSIKEAILPNNILSVHLMVMLILTLMIFIVTFRKNNILKRYEGFSLLIMFCSYLTYIIFQS